MFQISLARAVMVANLLDDVQVDFLMTQRSVSGPS